MAPAIRLHFDTNPRAWASAWPINETASAAPVITPSVPLASDKTLGVQVFRKHPRQKFMNKIKSPLRPAHRSPGQPILSQISCGIGNLGIFESRKNEGILEDLADFFLLTM